MFSPRSARSPLPEPITVLDASGHDRAFAQRLVRAPRIDVALLAISARLGVDELVRMHARILGLLQVRRLVAVLASGDEAREPPEAVGGRIRALLAEGPFPDAPLLVTSPGRDDGPATLRRILLEARGEPPSDEEDPWYLPLDRLTLPGPSRAIATGLLACGRPRAGDEAVFSPSGRAARVSWAHVLGAKTARVESGLPVALGLELVGETDRLAEEALGSPGALSSTREVAAKVRWAHQVRKGERVVVAIGNAAVHGRIGSASSGPDGEARFHLERPVACAVGQPLLVRRLRTAEWLAGGLVLASSEQGESGLQAESADPGVADLERLQGLLAAHPFGLAIEEIAQRAGLSRRRVESGLDALASADEAVRLAHLWLSSRAREDLARRLREALGRLHRRNPRRPFFRLEEVLAAAEIPIRGDPMRRLVERWEREGFVRTDGAEGIALAEHRVRLNARQRALLDRVRAALDEGGWAVPDARRLAHALSVPPQAVEEILRLGVAAGELVCVAEGQYYRPERLAELERVARDLGAHGPFTASEFREALGTSRKYAVPLLEYLNARGVTIREGERHRLAPKS